MHARKDRGHVLANLDKLVVKPANESGGYGMMVGPHATSSERKRFAELIQKDPRNYMAQPTLSISTSPTLLCDDQMEPRHVDLRPFILSGPTTYVTTGGLTRVALRKVRWWSTPRKGWQQGHLDRRYRGLLTCCHASPRTSIGWPVKLNGPKIPLASSMSTAICCWICRAIPPSAGCR